MNRFFTLQKIAGGKVGALLIALLFPILMQAQEHSVAMKWNEVQLNCIRKDAARPTIQARNLLHSSILMYDCWAVYDDDASTFFLGQDWNGFTCAFDGIQIPEDRQAAQEKAMSYAMYRFLFHRYQNAPLNNWNVFMIGYCNDLMAELGYPTDVTSTDYSDGDPAKLGNYIALKMQQFAVQDGSNQQFNYANLYYQTVNGDLLAEQPGNPLQYDGNRWQPLTLEAILDQNGFPIANSAPALSPEWGNVVPFAMTDADKQTFQRDGFDWNVYFDPGPPPLLDTITEVERQYDEDFFRWGYSMVAIWHSFHDISDGVMKDVSPASIGGLDHYYFPQTFEEYKDFYNYFDGGDNSPGYTVNPATGLPYEPQIVPRADYSRVLSEYWADGPQSETPPGHWFTIVNSVMNHPLFEKRWEGQGEILNDLEFDVRAYLALGGGVHDAAIACWSAKGYYDYTRPIMAIRYMIDHGQCSDMNLPSYDPAGIPLIPGFIELVQPGDPLAGDNDENVNKIKLYTFRGPVEATGLDGVGWILGENWWTFQVRTFVTPPFPGYYSGHSTYSRTAAEVLTALTGSEYYPGGYGEFFAAQDEYLRASPGPSVDVRLQWATYKDASDQCSLSRIYGGLHPPCDDIPGRIVGSEVGPMVFNKANSYMNAGIPHVASITCDKTFLSDADAGTQMTVVIEFTEEMDAAAIPTISFPLGNPIGTIIENSASWIDANHYQVVYDIVDVDADINNVTIKVQAAADMQANFVVPALQYLLDIDMFNPVVASLQASETVINDAVAQNGILIVNMSFVEPMNTDVAPALSFPDQDIAADVVLNENLSYWENDMNYVAIFDLLDNNNGIGNINLYVNGAQDAHGNVQDEYVISDAFILDTENPILESAAASASFVNTTFIGNTFTVSAVYAEEMDTNIPVTMSFSSTDPFTNTLGTLESEGWVSGNTYEWTYTVNASDEELPAVFISTEGAVDIYGNPQAAQNSEELFGVDTHPANLVSATANATYFNDAAAGSEVLSFTVVFDDEMDMSLTPVIAFSDNAITSNSLIFNGAASSWQDDFTFLAVYDVMDVEEEFYDIQITVTEGWDVGGNPLNNVEETMVNLFVDTKNPSAISAVPSSTIVTNANVGTDFTIAITFDEPMGPFTMPVVTFPFDNTNGTIVQNLNGFWQNETTYVAAFDVVEIAQMIILGNIDIQVAETTDSYANPVTSNVVADVFSLDLEAGVAEWNITENISLYPNPIQSGASMTLELSSVPSNLTVTVLDGAGKLVKQLPVQNQGSTQLFVSTAGLSAGNYFLQLNSGVDTALLKFTVTK